MEFFNSHSRLHSLTHRKSYNRHNDGIVRGTGDDVNHGNLKLDIWLCAGRSSVSAMSTIRAGCWRVQNLRVVLSRHFPILRTAARLGECLGSNLTPPDATKRSSGKRQRKAIRPDSSFASWRNSAP